MTKISYQKLREHLLNTKKYPRCKKVKRAPLIHEGFPGTFNLSFTEYDMFKEFGGYSKFTKNIIFSTIQSCIRMQDILENIKTKNNWKYLGTFEMVDIAGQILLSKKEDIKKIHTYQLKRLIKILENLGLKKENLHPSYQKGGKVSRITKGKYNFDFIIPEDTLTKQEFIKAGIPEKNLIPDQTRDTLLSLHINMPTPWGYRSEINYNIGTKEKPKLLDIATLEYFLWIPTYSSSEKISKNVNGLKSFPHTASVGAFGLERLHMATNKLENIFEIDYIKKFYDSLKKFYPELKKENQIAAGEAIRTLHRIDSDILSFNIKNIGKKNRKKKINQLLRMLKKEIPKLNKEKIKKLLEKNTEIQPWHNNLAKGINPTIKRIKTYYSK